MKKFLVSALVVCLGCIVFVSAAFPEVTFDYGASLRVRQEIWDNLIDLKTLDPVTPDMNFFRFKASLWGSANYNKDASLFLKLTAEPYLWYGPLKPKRGDGEPTSLDENEGVFDNLYVKVNNVFGLPVDLKIGRQDFLTGEDMYGERFLFADGTPQDGSRTFYFNAAKARWKIDKENSVDFVYITNQYQDRYLPTWRTQIADGLTYYNGKKYLDTSDSQAFSCMAEPSPLLI